jgi:hypothetical protein
LTVTILVGAKPCFLSGLILSFFGGIGIAPSLDEEVRNLAFIVHGTPEGLALPLEDDHHLARPVNVMVWTPPHGFSMSHTGAC